MRQIYLAISKDDERSLLIRLLREKYRGVPINEITSLQDIETFIYEPFGVLITERSFLDLTKVNLDKIDGQIWYIDQSGEQNISSGIISYFSNISELGKWLKVEDLANRDILNPIQTKSWQDNNTQNEHIDYTRELENNNTEDDKTEEKKGKVETILFHNHTKEEMDQEQNEKYNLFHYVENSDANFGKPVSFQTPYPKDDQILKKIREDSENLKDEQEGDIFGIQKYQQNNTPLSSFQYEYDPLSERAIAIRKGAFSRARWERNRTIGIWSPIHRMGVTSFVFNFSIFLAQYKVPVAVIEALNKHQFLKTLLTRYQSPPRGWHSFVETLYDSKIPPNSVEWVYKGVHWIPLGDYDYHYEWNQELLYHYMNSVKFFDFVFVDLPTGEMQQHTLDTLEHIDEIWILIDDSRSQILSWKKYIHKLLKQYQLSCRLIFNKKYNFSKDEQIARELEITLLTSIPPLHSEFAMNNYKTEPLIEIPAARSKLKQPFEEISKYILGEDFIKDNVHSLIYKVRSLLQSFN
jgi:hypothetical protein